MADIDERARNSLYRSTDLLNWEKIGAVITIHTPDEGGNQLLAWCRLERPKLMKSKKTGKYVIWIVSLPEQPSGKGKSFLTRTLAL